MLREDHCSYESSDKRLLTVKEAADLLHVSPSAVYQLIDAHRLACHRIGTGRGTIRISRHDLNTFLDVCRQERQEQVVPVPQVPLRHLKT
ncbi:MAG: helix-turn-helix domain-containing protein [Planctomycetota bacterium]